MASCWPILQGKSPRSGISTLTLCGMGTGRLAVGNDCFEGIRARGRPIIHFASIFFYLLRRSTGAALAGRLAGVGKGNGSELLQICAPAFHRSIAVRVETFQPLPGICHVFVFRFEACVKVSGCNSHGVRSYSIVPDGRFSHKPVPGDSRLRSRDTGARKLQYRTRRSRCRREESKSSHECPNRRRSRLQSSAARPSDDREKCC